MMKRNLMLSFTLGAGILLAGCGATEEPPPEDDPVMGQDEQAPPAPDGMTEDPGEPTDGTTEDDENLTDDEKDKVEKSVEDNENEQP
ncbi:MULTISPECIES: hypothetical protein [unclassified Mesobacillus]|uniref:hypothetical protein n=1 Tax=unclassified Mesobacillus TaxID=2675270 RepID=UPI00203F1BC8|nr:MULTISPECIES: hypothetical protein [unclassified Mesobacillus]MCM3125042.1 hypothetical protein [Mesobacillus sp. MER 33]MCM3235198.1 hypothetical protein [Mesobacillus sp. MER 48]